MLFVRVFGEVSDPRDCSTRYDLTEMLFVSLAAVLCGAKSCTEIAQFGKSRLELLRQYIPLEYGVPSHDTFSRVFRLLDPKELNAALVRFMAAFGEAMGLQTKGVVAVDGKSVRGAYERGRAHMPKLVASVYACDTFLTLSQAVAEEGGETEAAIQALKLLSLEGCVVTADALHCHRRMTQTIRKAAADYALAIKANQSKLYEEASLALDLAARNPFTPAYETRDCGHDRLERRRAIVVPFAQSPGKNNLIDLCAVARVDAWRTLGGATSHHVRHFALSREMSPEEVLSVTRSHWRIENNLHWSLDVCFREDAARNRKDHGPANLAAIRRLAMNVLRTHPAKISLNLKQQRAAWETDFLTELMTHVR